MVELLMFGSETPSIQETHLNLNEHPLLEISSNLSRGVWLGPDIASVAGLVLV